MMGFRERLPGISALLLTVSPLMGCGDQGSNLPPDPSIQSLSATPAVVLDRFGESSIVAVAADPKGDSLTFAWEASGGSITGNGASVVWAAPGVVGTYTIALTVSNETGRSANDAVSVEVRNGAPTITSLTSTLQIVSTGGETIITAGAVDPEGDPLTYAWEAPEASLIGTAESVTWMAPGEEGTYPIILTVSDGEGGVVTDTVTVDVLNGSLLVSARGNLTVVRFDGTRSELAGTYRLVEVLGTRIFVNIAGGIAELDHDGSIISRTYVSEQGWNGLQFTIHPDGGFSFLDNRSDSLLVMAPDGTVLAHLAMPDPSPIVWQNLDGIVVGDRLIVSETGNNSIFEVNLTTFQTSIFLSIVDDGGWLGAIEYDVDGSFYFGRPRTIHRYTDGVGIQDLCTLPEGSISAIASAGRYLFAAVNPQGAVYRINRFTGESEVLVDGLDRLDDLEFIPVIFE